MHNLPPIGKQMAKRLKTEDIWQNGRLKSLDEINQASPVQFSLASYLRISGSIHCWNKRVLQKKMGKQSLSIPEFLSRFRKGSKSFQILLNTSGVSDKIQVKCFTSFCRAAKLVPVPFALPFTEVELSFLKRGDCLALWATVPMNNRFRDFLFKFFTNRLSTGARIGHFNINIDESCFHCRLEKKFPAPRETFSHMFFDCPVVNNLQKMANRVLWPELNQNMYIEKSFWLCGIQRGENVPRNMFLQTAICLFNYFVWECRLRKKAMGWESCKLFIIEHLGSMCAVNIRLTEDKNNINISLSRQC
jgi:hypothetical protein